MCKICFVLCEKEKLCIRIPEYRVVQRYPPEREPDPRGWLTVGAKFVDVAQDLQILASIEGLARDLSPEVRRTVRTGIEQAAHSMKGRLPEGAELHFGEQTAE